jgi:predicted nucleic acid-binding protein
LAAVDRVIFNTGPLIALASAESLHLVHELVRQPLTTSMVAGELAAGVTPASMAVSLDGIRVLEVAEVPQALLAVVDPGEASVIHAALRDPGAWACLDDRRGRSLAKVLAIPHFGALGLLMRARQGGLIPAIRPVVEAMERAGYYYRKTFVEGVLRDAGEAKTAEEDE